MKKSFILFLGLLCGSILDTVAQKVNMAAKTAGSKVEFLSEINNELWFYSYYALWKYQPGKDSADIDNAKKIAAINPSSLANPAYGTVDGQFATYNNKAFYLSYRGDMWVSDGTAAGTKALKQTSFNGVLNLMMCSSPIGVFASGGSKGGDLWKSDGTVAGTVKVKTLATGGDKNRIYDMRYMLGKLYLLVSEDGSNYNIWCSDGTEAGTVKISSSFAFMGDDVSLQKYACVFKSKVYFVAGTSVSATNIYETDGTATGTKIAITPSQTPNGVGAPIMSTDDYLFVVAASVYSYDGTAVNTLTGKHYGTSLAKGIISGKYLYFFSHVLNTKLNECLYRSDGSNKLADSITALPKDIGPFNITAYKDTLYFFAAIYSGDPDGQPWKSDGTAAGTVKIEIDSSCTDVIADRSISAINLLRAYNNHLYYSGTSSKTGYALFKLGGKDAVLSVERKSNTNAMTLYPNPSSGTIHLKNVPDNAEIHVFNALGEEVCSRKDMNDTEIDLSGQVKGIYFVQITKGKERFAQKVLLQ